MTDRSRWGCAALALAVVLALLDWVSTTAAQATLLIVCLLAIGSSLLISDAVATRKRRGPG